MPESDGAASVLRVVVGLGNPGRRYENTPHNLGFMVVDRLAEQHDIRVKRRESEALVGAGAIAGARVLLAKPQTFMNHSGASVRALLEKFSASPRDMILVYDDLDLAWTAVRIRDKGSPGGHHGVESVSGAVGTTDFPRIRLGIAGYRVEDGAQFVLAPFRRAQREELDELLSHAAQAVESIISVGVEKSMAMFNRRARGQQTEEE
ncbi:MAG TPA: aminoacyl-tRNA hydrolase [Bryobacteraceae bacterium]|nr:aminoacyl-tRNA hydrolase [Bryobacteraceae bacterium]